MMINMEVAPPDNRETSVRGQWLDKLWFYLFDGSGGGLMSPGQIRREHRNREQIRQLEMASILEAENRLSINSRPFLLNFSPSSESEIILVMACASCSGLSG